jgi:general secretion pathway protein F
MPKFHYKAVAANGELLEGKMDAATQGMVISKLQNAGHIPISANEITSSRSPSRLNQLTTFFQKDKINDKDITLLTRELATLLHAGLPLDNALQTLEELSSPGLVKNMVMDVHVRVQGGTSFSEALDAQNGVFSQLYLNMIRAGEVGGALDAILERLADYLEQTAELKATIKSALIYPSILFVIAGVSVFVLLLFVVPQFVPLFEDVGQALPLPTQIVFGSAEFLRQYWWILLGVFAAAIWIIDQQLQDPVNRQRWDAKCLSLPVYGELITKLEVARFSRTLGTLLVNGVPVLTAVTIVRKIIVNRVIANVVDAVATSLEQGQDMAQPLLESGHFPALAVQLIQVGEGTGQLENMLIKIADIYDNEVRTMIKRLLTLLEPILIIGLGAVIAFIIVSILVAILGLNELVI